MGLFNNPRFERAVLARLEEIMSAIAAIADFVAKLNAYQDAQGQEIDALTTEVQGLKNLLDKINNSPAALDPADQTALDQAIVRAKLVTDRLTALANVEPPAPPDVPPAPATPSA